METQGSQAIQTADISCRLLCMRVLSGYSVSECVCVYLVILRLCSLSSALGSFLFFFTTGITEPLVGFTSWATEEELLLKSHVGTV